MYSARKLIWSLWVCLVFHFALSPHVNTLSPKKAKLQKGQWKTELTKVCTVSFPHKKWTKKVFLLHQTSIIRCYIRGSQTLSYACFVNDPHQVQLNALLIGAVVIFRCCKVNWSVNSSRKLVRYTTPTFPVGTCIKQDRVLGKES